MLLSLWMLIPAVVLLPLIFNLWQWRRDLERLRDLDLRRKGVPNLGRAPLPLPKVSFLVAAWNEEPTLRRCLEAIQRLEYPDLEIVLCAGGRDGTWRAASGFSDARLILLAQQPGDGKQGALQRCLERASGEIVYLLDAGCLITGEAFARILGPIVRHVEQAVTSSPSLPFPEQIAIPFVVSQCASQVYTSIYQPAYSHGLLGANSAIRRERLEQAGGFNGAVRTGGDYDLGKRLVRQGTRVRYEVDATFPIEFHTQVRAYLRQQSRWIRNVVIHGVRFGAYREVASCLATSLVGLAMLVLPCLSLLMLLSTGTSAAVARAGMGVWGLAFLHAFFSRVRYVRVAARRLGVRFPQRVLWMLPLFLLVDFLAWSIPLVQYPSRALRERW